MDFSNFVMVGYGIFLLLLLASIPIGAFLIIRHQNILSAYGALKRGEKYEIMQSLDCNFLMGKTLRKQLQTKLKEIELEELDAQILMLPPKR